jgi:hypothetical protein
MPNFENITGPKVFDLIQDLIKGKALVKVSIQGKDFERLTVILAIHVETAGIARFQIDPPEGLWLVLRQLRQPILYFEFMSQDRLPHRFEIPLADPDTEGWLPCPRTIKRYQLRNDFRINAPANAYATAIINEAEFKMAIDNISLGGFFCHCPNSAKALLFKDQIIENLSLVFSFGGEYQMLPIGRVVVRRIDGRTRQRHFGVAFEFTLVDDETKKRLVQLVYALQREYLQNRTREA